MMGVWAWLKGWIIKGFLRTLLFQIIFLESSIRELRMLSKQRVTISFNNQPNPSFTFTDWLTTIFIYINQFLCIPSKLFALFKTNRKFIDFIKFIVDELFLLSYCVENKFNRWNWIKRNKIFYSPSKTMIMLCMCVDLFVVNFNYDDHAKACAFLNSSLFSVNFCFISSSLLITTSACYMHWSIVYLLSSSLSIY